jgi:hypothetical protein
MLSAPYDLFPHRRNGDGSFDSICTRCFQTIASRFSEVALAEAERLHTCDGPPLMHSWQPVPTSGFSSART